MSQSTQRSTLETLTTDECLELLAKHELGRLAISGEEGPMIFPVNYAFSEPNIVIHTDTGTKLATAPMTTAAFEIDGFAPDGSWGWSVVAQGPVFDVTTAVDDYSALLQQLHVPAWSPGEKTHVLKITARRVTGRRFGDVDTMHMP